MIEIEHCILRACTSKPALEPVQKKSGMMGKVWLYVCLPVSEYVSKEEVSK